MSSEDQKNYTEGLDALRADLKANVSEFTEAESTRENAEAFAKSIREQLQRARGHLSQAEVARRMGLRHQSRVSRIENGGGDLTLEAIYRYARAVGCEPRLELIPQESSDEHERDLETRFAYLEEEVGELREILSELRRDRQSGKTTGPAYSYRTPDTNKNAPSPLFAKEKKYGYDLVIVPKEDGGKKLGYMKQTKRLLQHRRGQEDE